MSTARILAFAGSLRTGSFNKKLARVAADLAKEAGAQATFVDLRDFQLPLYDGDIEETQGLPEGAKQLKGLMREHDGFLIASPEYNSSFTGALKNAIDWVSRAEADDEPPLVAFKGKLAAIMSASPGALGGMRGLLHLRNVLGNIGVIVLPDQVTVPQAPKAFTPEGGLADETKRRQLQGMVETLVRMIVKLKA